MDKQQMTVLLIEPEARPKEVTIDAGLESLQKAVGGWIEAIYPFEDPVALIVNEEGKLDGLPLNRALRHQDGEIYDIMAGNILVVGLGDEDFKSLSPKLMSKYKEMFHQPEAFFQMGRKILALPIPDHQVKGEESPKKPTAKNHNAEL